MTSYHSCKSIVLAEQYQCLNLELDSSIAVPVQKNVCVLMDHLNESLIFTQRREQL